MGEEKGKGKDVVAEHPETESNRVTEGVRIQVRSEYVESHSSPQAGRYVFAYHITITNETHPGAVHLRTRHWIITDQLGKVEEVRGPGVVGEEPILKPGQSFGYTSGAILTTPRGSMEGSYAFDAPDGPLEVAIGRFALAKPFSLN